MGIKAFNHGDDFVNKFVRAIVSDSTGLDAASQYVAPTEPIQASGGIISDYTDPGPGNIYRAHIFNSSGTFVVTEENTNPTLPGDVEIFAIGGGGAGGAYTGAGGGGGGAFRVTSYPISAATYPITIGAGGVSNSTNSVAQPKGGNTVFTDPTPNPNLTALGGGGGASGGSPHPDSNNDGGSGGGGNANGRGSVLQPAQNPGVSNLTNFGQVGGTGAGPGQGGGGGAGADGSHGSPNVGGAGGNGTPNVYAYGPGSAVTYGGGGAGGRNGAGQSSGGSGGGGKSRGPANSDTPSHPDSCFGEFAKGGGGGGADNNSTPKAGNRGGHGGSGTLIVRYQIGSISSAKATGGAVSFYNGKTIHIFTSSGTFTNTSGSALAVEYIAIAGGGGGGVHASGGGGAGGVISNIPGFMPNVLGAPNVSPGSPNALTITIGAGGAAQSNPSPGANGFVGANTTITGPGPWNQTAYGGGYGGGIQNAGGPGGSGGGGAHSGQSGGTRNPNSAPTYQGNPGGSGNSSGNGAGGGGGGAGGPGINSPGPVGGAGGLGIQLPSAYRNPTAVYGFPGASPGGFFFAGGGGAGGDANPAPEYARGGKGSSNGNSGDNHAGAGGGGAGNPGTLATSAETNSGSGGGGRGYAPYQPNSYGGAGGSGIVFIAYPT